MEQLVLTFIQSFMIVGVIVSMKIVPVATTGKNRWVAMIQILPADPALTLQEVLVANS